MSGAGRGDMRHADPHALALMAPGAPYETRVEGIGEDRHEVFACHPRTLMGIYRHAAEPAERRLLICGDATLTAGELFGRAASLGAWLGTRGVAKGDTVAIALPAGVGWAIAFLAITALGARAALVNTRGAGEEMAHAVRSVAAKLVFADDERATALRATGIEPAIPIVEAATMEQAIADHHGAPLALADVMPDDGAIILYTSGTTGYPKPVLQTHGALSHAAVLGGLLADLQDRAYEREFDTLLAPERRAASAATVIASPLFHVGGVTPLLRGLYFHAPLFIMPRWDADTAFALMERETVSRLGFVPAMLLDMIRSPRADARNLGSITLLSNGAASLDPRIVAEIRAKMPRVMLANSYGMTECAGWCSSIYGEDYLAHPDSAGHVLPTIEVRIADGDDRPVAPGEHGEILIRSACIMREYIGAPEATAETLRGGWLHTGDIGWADPEGRIQIADRLKNMIISGGENIYAAEVERVLGDHPEVREVIAYGVADERLGERVTATVVPGTGASPDPEVLRAYARTRLAGYKVPKRILIRDTPLPRTSTMKVDRGAFLREARTPAAADA